jgi:coenzyme PQQ precursor peptide PqqA
MAEKIVIPWEPPAFTEISVSAEATMYLGAWQEEDWG